MPPKPITTVSAWMLKTLCRGAHTRFMQDLKNPQAVQRTLLKSITTELSRTSFGRHYGITGGEDYKTFSARIPVQSYEELKPWADAQITGKAALSPHRTLHIEPTSGSSGAVKCIPYTRPLLSTFSNMFRIWAFDLLNRELAPETGRVFMSISAQPHNGFHDDRAYLDQPLRGLLSPFLVMPHSRDMDAIATALADARDLEVISIWSPSYLLAVMERIEAIKGITIKDWHAVWPKLKLVSCWDSGQAAPLAESLAYLLPGVKIQGKGLLATEAPLTIPLQNGCAPLLHSVFFEFMMPDGSIRLLHDIKAGDRAEVILSLRGGFTRYRLGDILQAGAPTGNTPTFAFIGRSAVSDIAGEKLDEAFVRDALAPLLPRQAFLLLPAERHYVLAVDSTDEALAATAEDALCRSFHYKHARRLGQLLPLRIMVAPRAAEALRALKRDNGMKEGDIKDVALVTSHALARQLIGRLEKMPQPARRITA